MRAARRSGVSGRVGALGMGVNIPQRVFKVAFFAYSLGAIGIFVDGIAPKDVNGRGAVRGPLVGGG